MTLVSDNIKDTQFVINDLLHKMVENHFNTLAFNKNDMFKNPEATSSIIKIS